MRLCVLLFIPWPVQGPLLSHKTVPRKGTRQGNKSTVQHVGKEVARAACSGDFFQNGRRQPLLMLSESQRSTAVQPSPSSFTEPKHKARTPSTKSWPHKRNWQPFPPGVQPQGQAFSLSFRLCHLLSTLPQTHAVPSPFPAFLPAQKRLISTRVRAAWRWRAQKPYWAPIAALGLLSHKAERRMLKLGLQDGLALLINTIKATPAISKQWYN